MLQLYFGPGACSFVPHVALEAAQAEYEPKLVKLHRGEHRTPEYLAMNPNGQAPADACQAATTALGEALQQRTPR